MNSGYLLQMIMAGTGIVLLLLTTHSLAKRVLTESLSLFWGVISVLFILAGLLLAPVEWNRYISRRALVIVVLGMFVTLAGLYYLSIQMSYLIRKNQELAMQISLLNQEHEKITYYLTSLTGKSKNQIWRTKTTAEHEEAGDKKDIVIYEKENIAGY